LHAFREKQWFRFFAKRFEDWILNLIAGRFAPQEREGE